MNELANNINFTTANNQPNFRSLLGYIWYLYYSSMSVGVVVYDFNNGLDQCFCGGDRFDENGNSGCLKCLHTYMLSLLSIGTFAAESFGRIRNVLGGFY